MKIDPRRVTSQGSSNIGDPFHLVRRPRRGLGDERIPFDSFQRSTAAIDAARKTGDYRAFTEAVLSAQAFSAYSGGQELTPQHAMEMARKAGATNQESLEVASTVVWNQRANTNARRYRNLPFKCGH